MKKFQFLLLDTGPIIKLFELGIWEDFIRRCDVTVSQTVADQAKWASQELEDIRINLDPYKNQELINVFDVDISLAKSFHNRFNEVYKTEIHSGEKETLAFLCNSSENWLVCAADKVVFRVLGLLSRAEQGISLEEILVKIGLSQSKLEWEYTKKFREKYTLMGQADSIQDKGLL